MSKVYTPFYALLFCLFFTLIASLQDAQGQAYNQRSGQTFPTINAAVQAARDYDVINVAPGTYVEDVLIDKPLRLIGAGRDVTTVLGVRADSNRLQATILITATGSSVEGFTITREGNNTRDWNDSLNVAGIMILDAQHVSIKSNTFRDNQVGLELNNSSADSIENNIIEFNRTGILLRNTCYYNLIERNDIIGNYSVGVQWESGNPTATDGTYIRNNRIEGNWYAQVDNRTAEGGQKYIPGNWYGTSTPTTDTAFLVPEPTYENQIPSRYGGRAEPPTSGAVTIRASTTRALLDIVYTPYISDTGSNTLASVVTTPIETAPTTVGDVVIATSIPAGTMVTTPPDATWDGVINPPTLVSNDAPAPAGFQVGSTVIEVGSPTTTLYFSSPAVITLQGVTDSVAYSAPGTGTWTMISEGCSGTYENPGSPSSPTGECFISNGTDTKIVTYHFTRFAGMKDILPLRLQAPATVNITANNSGCTAKEIALGTPVVKNKYTLLSLTHTAPAVFPEGETEVIWTAVDAQNNKATAKQIVTVSGVKAAIPPSYAVTKGVAANTVYPGYVPAAAITLHAQASGGSGSYAYRWSNGVTSSSITVSPTAATSYQVHVEDSYGCKSSDDITIKVQNVSCAGGKVSICHVSDKNLLHDKTICIDATSVQDHLAHGCMLGGCTTVRTATGTGSRDAMQTEENRFVSLTIAPNPSASSFRIVVAGDPAMGKVHLRVFDAGGRVIENRSNIAPHTVLMLGEQYRRGVYLIEVRQGAQRIHQKVVKI
jgi:hypothetical protein